MQFDQFGHEVTSLYTFVPIKVAGVTFKNGRRWRQTILKQIRWKEEPYQNLDGIQLVASEYNGEPSVEVWAYNKKSREMIGYIPKKEAEYCHSHIDSFVDTFNFEVYGGGSLPDGTKISYGASFVARFQNDPNAILTGEAYDPSKDPVIARATAALSSRTSTSSLETHSSASTSSESPLPSSFIEDSKAFIEPSSQTAKNKNRPFLLFLFVALIVLFVYLYFSY